MNFILVKNTPPHQDRTVSGEELQLFRQVISDSEAYPFTHQAQAFQLIGEGRECILVAGTAAGKTLAVLVPLLLRVQKGESRKAMFLYPALALLEDQLETIRKAAACLGMEEQVGYIYGGMSRQELIAQLNKKIIVATPDAVYWFLEKNVKYNSLLFYALCHVDDFVLDEAHLLSGLMGYNLKKFLDRLSDMRQTFLQKERFRTHVLTATPTEVVSTLSQGEMIYGRSKVGTVQFEFEPQQQKPEWGKLIRGEVERGFSRMLLVLNSAAGAHRIFFEETVESDHPALHSFYSEFGYAAFGTVVETMLACGGNAQQVEEWASASLAQESWALQEFSNEKLVTLSLERVMEATSKALRHESGSKLMEEWESIVADYFQEAPERTATVAEWKAWVTPLKQKTEFSLVFAEVEQKFLSMTVPFSATSLTIQELCRLGKPKLYLSSLEAVCEQASVSFPRLKQKLIDRRAIRLPKYISILKDTNIPVILYTGSMPKRARRGLIQAFQSSDAPQAILISTSAVEVGVDFDVDLLVTESCTGSSFLQRFGRVGRRGGGHQRVRLVTQDGSVTGKLQESFAGRQEVTRETFSEVVESVMKKRLYFTSSPYLDVLHRHVTRRLGEVGRLLVPERDPLETTLLEKGGFRYGLRSTIPQVDLRDEGIGRDPFQILGNVESDQLRVVDSPFSVAEANLYFDEWIYKPREAKVLIDQVETLKRVKLLLYFHRGRLHHVEPEALLLRVKEGYSFTYDSICHAMLNEENNVKSLLKTSYANDSSLKLYLEALLENPKLNHYLLGLGDVFLTKFQGGGIGREITDRDGQKVMLKDQMFLVEPKQNKQNNLIIKNEEVWYTGYEQELHVNSNKDYMNKSGSGVTTFGHIALDRVAGACVALYRELVQP
ncbi:MAG TPA: DEAD/DEAH box helicase [Bacilli bacterium]|nr:DEAD/DEAH box helicase [Bacilli bacterium]